MKSANTSCVHGDLASRNQKVSPKIVCSLKFFGRETSVTAYR